jgi:predicted nucleic acid-binding protein
MVALDSATPERVMAAARIKAQYPLAYADAFAIATAAAHDAVLLTGDRAITARSVGCRVQNLAR